MTDRTLREKIAAIFAEDDAFVGIGRDSYDKADRVLALIDAHTVEQPAPDAVAEAQAWRDVQAERQRQISAEGWTPEHDDAHTKRELAAAATCYASVYPLAASYWPWDLEWWKPTDHRRNLVKAGALILAEIERLDRAALTQTDHKKGN